MRRAFMSSGIVAALRSACRRCKRTSARQSRRSTARRRHGLRTSRSSACTRNTLTRSRTCSPAMRTSGRRANCIRRSTVATTGIPPCTVTGCWCGSREQLSGRALRAGGARGARAQPHAGEHRRRNRVSAARGARVVRAALRSRVAAAARGRVALLERSAGAGVGGELAPLETEAAARIKRWLPELYYPIRVGEHDQTAFSFGLIWDWAGVAGDRGDAPPARRTRRNVSTPPTGTARCAYEPSGQDFLSPCLAEADFMRRVLDQAAFARWLTAFLPMIPANARAEWLTPARRDQSQRPQARASRRPEPQPRVDARRNRLGALPPGDRRVPALSGAAKRHREAALPR